MQYTVSIHRRTEKDYVREHNNRSRDLGDFEAHIGRARVYENWKEQGVREAYQEIFGEAVREKLIKNGNSMKPRFFLTFIVKTLYNISCIAMSKSIVNLQRELTFKTDRANFVLI